MICILHKQRSRRILQGVSPAKNQLPLSTHPWVPRLPTQTQKSEKLDLTLMSQFRTRMTFFPLKRTSIGFFLMLFFHDLTALGGDLTCKRVLIVSIGWMKVWAIVLATDPAITCRTWNSVNHDVDTLLLTHSIWWGEHSELRSERNGEKWWNALESSNTVLDFFVLCGFVI